MIPKTKQNPCPLKPTCSNEGRKGSSTSINLSGFIYLGQPIRKTAQCKSGLLYGDLKVVVCWAMALGPSFKIRNIFQSKNHLRITLLT